MSFNVAFLSLLTFSSFDFRFLSVQALFSRCIGVCDEQGQDLQQGLKKHNGWFQFAVERIFFDLSVSLSVTLLLPHYPHSTQGVRRSTVCFPFARVALNRIMVCSILIEVYEETETRGGKHTCEESEDASAIIYKEEGNDLTVSSEDHRRRGLGKKVEEQRGVRTGVEQGGQELVEGAGEAESEVDCSLSFFFPLK
jgi:hypothetical protein